MQPAAPQVPDPSVPPVPGIPAVPPVAVEAEGMPPVALPNAPEPAQQPAPAVPAVKTPAMADDNDLIENEWVAQVKHIMSSSAHDPYELSRQFSLLKADYMQKRYGKTIKSDN